MPEKGSDGSNFGVGPGSDTQLCENPLPLAVQELTEHRPWLRGCSEYEAVFRENDIDGTVLPNLTAEDLKELGVASLGHRR
jgi:hypothetical protein